MREFDLAAAKAGAAVCTMDGAKVRIICFDRISTKFPIIGLRRNTDNEEYVVTFTTNGRIFYTSKDGGDLMMRDDDYAEKLARGEYGNHIEDKFEKVDREHLRRELSEKIMVAMIRELAGKSPHSTNNNITVFEAMAADAVSYADALLEELDKKK